MNILDNQIEAQIEGRTNIKIQYVKEKGLDDSIRLYEQKGIYFLGLRMHDKAISKAEYLEILNMAKQDKFGNLLITIDQEYDWFWNKYWNFRDNEKLQKIGNYLFGKSWKKSLAESLKVDERRITHWLQCTRPVPIGVWSDLKIIADSRKSQVQDAIDMLTLSVEELTHKAAQKALN